MKRLIEFIIDFHNYNVEQRQKRDNKEFIMNQFSRQINKW